jgi:curved DNA-binding protein CbpA
MGAEMALRAAIELFHMPSRVRIARAEPLPTGVGLLLRIAAGEAEAEGTAIASTRRSRDLIRQAAIFFIEQVLLCPDSDSYRVLGADSQASSGELRRNMALLLKWLHPDKDPQGQRSVFASRVNQAWNDLKTPERRASYDESRGRVLAHQRSKTRGKSRTGASSNRMLASPRQPCASPMHIAKSQNLWSRAWLLLLSVAAMKRRSMALDTKMLTSYQPKYRSRGLKAILFAGIAAVLVWELVSRTFVAFSANVVPEQALHIRSHQSTALLDLAQKKLDAVDNSNQASRNVQERGSEANLGGAFLTDGFHDADRADARGIEQARRMAERALLSDPLNARALWILGQIADLSGDEPRSWRLMQASARSSLNET